MIKSVGSDYIVTGHSERRAIFGDDDETVNKKTKKVLAEGLKAILCIGELKEERESGETFNVCDTQLTKGLAGVTAEMMKDIVIAYEPVWAIGTGLTATPGWRRRRTRTSARGSSRTTTRRSPMP